MEINGRAEQRRLYVALGLLGCLITLGVFLAVSGHLTRMVSHFWEIFKDREELRHYIESWGVWAPAAFIVLQGLQVVMAPIPGEFTGAVGGFIFGTWPNIIYSTVGLTVGSLGAFLAARIIGLPLVRLFVSTKPLERFHFLTERRGIVLALILFTIPGFPKDALCYILGLSPMGLVPFTFACAVGRIPGTMMLSYCGCAAYDENWSLLIMISAVCAVLLGGFWLFRDRIDSWLRTRKSLPEPAHDVLDPGHSGHVRDKGVFRA